MRTLDRYVIKAFAINYLIALGVMVSLYIVLDLFFNFDEFISDNTIPPTQIIAGIFRYYGVQMSLYFSQISGVITLFAMAVTLGRMQRSNEFVAVVASGVSLYRIALTVIIAGAALNALWFIDQEKIIPHLAPELSKDHQAAVRQEPYGVWFLRDGDNSLLSAVRFDPQAGRLHRLLLMNTSGAEPVFITADSAEWDPGDRDDDEAGYWRLTRGARLIPMAVAANGTVDVRREPVDSFASGLGPEAIALRQSANWVQFLSRNQLKQMRDQGIASANLVSRAIHNRFATPIINVLILIIGIPFFLNREPAGVVQSGGRCLMACGACFLLAFFSQNIMPAQYALYGAWVPLAILTVVMVVIIDRMRT